MCWVRETDSKQVESKLKFDELCGKNEIRTLKPRMWMKSAVVHRRVRKRLTMDVTLWMSLTVKVTVTQLR